MSYLVMMLLAAVVAMGLMVMIGLKMASIVVNLAILMVVGGVAFYLTKRRFREAGVRGRR